MQSEKRVAKYLLQQHQKLFEPFYQISTGYWRTTRKNSVKIGLNCIWYSINLKRFAKKSKSLLELLQKVICYPFGKCLQKQAEYL
jgi:hypothetical protein